MKIEVFHAPGCESCATALIELRAVAATVDGVEWCEVNVLDSLARAVDLGVLTLPALAIDGELVFASLPTSEKLRRALLQRTGHD